MRFKHNPQKETSITAKNWSSFRFNGNTFTTQMDPESQAMKYPTPNPIYGSRNKAYDVDYLGGLNDADSTVAVATLDTNGSQYKLFDAGNLPVMFAYLGLGMEGTSRNDAYNQQFVNIMTESLSAAYATQLTDIAFLSQSYKTSIPQMSEGNGGLVGFMVWYQTVIQNVASVMAKYNTILSMSDYLIKMGYNYEAPITTQMMNLLKKQNLYSLFDQIGVIISQEYLDLDWYREITVLNGLPSRVADDVQSPLLTITGSTYVPSVEVTTSGGDILFSTMTEGEPGYGAFNNITIKVGDTETKYTFQGLVQHILSSLDPVDILAQCRQIHSGASSATVVSYVNDLIACMRGLVQVCSVFKNYTVDLRTFLMLLQNSTQLNHWVYETPYTAPSRPRIQLRPEYVRIIHDIFKAYGTNGDMVFDQTTRKWKIYTLWKAGEGIPEYDAYNGGFAIATSVRSIPASSSGYLTPDYMFPRMFYRYETTKQIYYQRFVNRLGTLCTMSVTHYDAAQLAQNPYFAYLNSIHSDDVTLNVPTVTMSTVTSDYTLMSTVNKLLVSLFGYGISKFGSGSSEVVNSAINTDNIMVVGREFGNFSEASIEYLTARAPMRQIDRDVNIGFRTTTVRPKDQ